jgi:hypothetical protein
MQPLSFVLAIIAPGLLAATLAACSNWPGHEGRESAGQPRSSHSKSGPVRGPGASAGFSGSAGATGCGAGSGQMGSGMTADHAALCELNRRIASARPNERQAMLDQYLPDMSPEMREQRLAMMREQCQ